MAKEATSDMNINGLAVTDTTPKENIFLYHQKEKKIEGDNQDSLVFLGWTWILAIRALYPERGDAFSTVSHLYHHVSGSMFTGDLNLGNIFFSLSWYYILLFV
ncbi:hypothetical protein ILYODFUR_025164 [Ilyodon furcidens]|uniref:Uncharacterized protein n=1 Tax=Ilyodon furcidens TaxID=33524 RepID=A0ABV0T0E0_9TELE